MSEDIILQQPVDRRIVNTAALPPGPPGAEFDIDVFETKNKAPAYAAEERKSLAKSSDRRRSRSPARKRRTPTSPPRRSRRTPSPRRNRFRDYSPDNRRRYGMRRSPDRRRNSPPPHRRGPQRVGAERFRAQRRDRSSSISSRSRSRSRSPAHRHSRDNNRYNKKKISSPIDSPNPGTATAAAPAMTPAPSAAQQYDVMTTTPTMYGDNYAGYKYNQYAVPPTATQGYNTVTAAPTAPVFNAAYPPPPTGWLMNEPPPYQQTWMPPGISRTTSDLNTRMPATNNATAAAINALPDAAPGTVETTSTLPAAGTAAAATTATTASTNAAVAMEKENHRDTLRHQRFTYLRRIASLRNELQMLQSQHADLTADGRPPSPTTKDFIAENHKLQSAIVKKLSTLDSVIDMLSGIIGVDDLAKDQNDAMLEVMADNNVEMHTEHTTVDKQNTTDKVTKTMPTPPSRQQHQQQQKSQQKEQTSSASDSADSGSSSSDDSDDSSSDSSSSSNNKTSRKTNKHDDDDDDDDSSAERLKNKVMATMRSKQKPNTTDMSATGKTKELKEIEPNKARGVCNYVFYDPEMHWCHVCNVFPKTAKDFLNHLHTKEHLQNDQNDTPWHVEQRNDQFPNYENAPTKRTPIRGLSFFVPAAAWYCKLCNFWMGDLHCASTHLKSQTHAAKYSEFLEKNPHFEMNWLADRQRALQGSKTLSSPITQRAIVENSMDTTTTDYAQQKVAAKEKDLAALNKKSKKTEEKVGKKHKKKSASKDKRKKKRSKKRKKNETSSSDSSSSSDSDSSTAEEKSTKMDKQTKPPIVIKDLDNPNPAASIRLAMRKQETVKADEITRAPPPPPPPPVLNSNANVVVANKLKGEDEILQQWSSVQPVISESEKKLFEQLKGKLKPKPNEIASGVGSTVIADKEKDKEREKQKEKEKYREKDRERERESERDRQKTNSRRDIDNDRRSRRSRSPAYGSGRRDSRSRSRSRGRGRRMRRSRSRGGGWGGSRRRISRSRSPRRRSRSRDRRRRSRTRSRSRSRSHSIEKPVLKHSAEFRPRVPEKEKEKTAADKEKKDAQKKSKTASSASAAKATTPGKKLPFIGKMPVFKKQTTGSDEMDKNAAETNGNYATTYATQMDQQQQQQQANRPPAPTAAQIQMAMMEDVYGNAPPFHPDAGVMMDYEDLMPDPVQFVNIMGQAPPPPPPPADDDEANDDDILPPGVDETENEVFSPKAKPTEADNGLPQDLEEALNIIFPGDKPENADDAAAQGKISAGETKIIMDEPVMHVDDLVKEGIHMVTLEETSLLGMDEASRMSMNEPLNFNKTNVPPSNVNEVNNFKAQDDGEAATEIIASVSAENTSNFNAIILNNDKIVNALDDALFMPDEIPIPPTVDEAILCPASPKLSTPETVQETANANAIDDNATIMAAMVCDLDDIPPPPASPTESEKQRRQEELDDLAMLGIDADDMAAQCV